MPLVIGHFHYNSLSIICKVPDPKNKCIKQLWNDGNRVATCARFGATTGLRDKLWREPSVDVGNAAILSYPVSFHDRRRKNATARSLQRLFFRLVLYGDSPLGGCFTLSIYSQISWWIGIRSHLGRAIGSGVPEPEISSFRYCPKNRAVYSGRVILHYRIDLISIAFPVSYDTMIWNSSHGIPASKLPFGRIFSSGWYGISCK